jgi:hypothetical protein
MKTKLGRPEMPEGKAKNVLAAVRLPADDVELIDAAVKQTKQERPEWMRNALIVAAKNAPVWVKVKWKREELDKKTVEFKLTAPDHYVKGRGVFRVLGNPKGELRIDISVITHETPYKITEYVYHLYQPTAHKIQVNPDSKKADFLVLA